MNHTVKALAKLSKKTPSLVEMYWRQAKRLHTNREEKGHWTKVLKTVLTMMKFMPDARIPSGIGDHVRTLGFNGVIIEVSADFFIVEDAEKYKFTLPLISLLFCDEPKKRTAADRGSSNVRKD